MDWKYLSICSLLKINIRFQDEDINMNFPKNCFGVNTTIKRSKNLNKYPFDIHGSSTHFSNSVINKNKILEYIIRTSKEAYGDKKSNYFEDILFDRNAYVEVIFMINDTKKLHLYDRKKGILSGKNIYLPDAYPEGIGLVDIKKDLGEDIFQFSVKKFDFSIIEIFNEKSFTDFWVNKIFSNIKNIIPTTIKNNIIKYNRSKKLTNIRCIDTILKHSNNKKVISNCNNFIKESVSNYKEYNLEYLSILIEHTTDVNVIDYFYNECLKNVDKNSPDISNEEILLILSEKFKDNFTYIDRKINTTIVDRRFNYDIKIHNLHSRIFKNFILKGGIIEDKLIKTIINQSINCFYFDNLLETKDLILLFECYVNLYLIKEDERLSNRIWILFVFIMKRVNNNYWINDKNAECSFDDLCLFINVLYLS